jgi:hypothetical protein
MSLDALYGSGTAAAFAARADLSGTFPNVASAVTEATCNDGAVHVEVTWTLKAVQVAACKLDFRARSVTYTSLAVVAALQGKGLYGALILKHPAWMTTLGVLSLRATPATPRSEYLLALGGFHWQTLDGERIFAALTAGGRMGEYRAWLAAGQPPASEPAWHAELIANPVGGGSEY